MATASAADRLSIPGRWPRPVRGRFPGPNCPSLLPARRQALPEPPNLPIGCGNTVCTSPSGFSHTLKADLPALETGAPYPEFCSSPMQKSPGRQADPSRRPCCRHPRRFRTPGPRPGKRIFPLANPISPHGVGGCHPLLHGGSREDLGELVPPHVGPGNGECACG